MNKVRQMNGHFYRLLFILLLNMSISLSNNYIVINTNDAGPGSLRWAMAEADNHSGADTVTFNIPTADNGYSGSGVWQITLATALPELIQGQTVIDGFSQRSNQGLADTEDLQIEINGEACPKGTPGLRIKSGDNVIRGLAIGKFPDSGIVISGTNASNNLIAGCFIGVRANGTERWLNQLSGIVVKQGANANIIGGTLAADRNVLSGNTQYGIKIEQSAGNLIIGNYIGVDRTGLVALPNGGFYPQENSAGVLIGAEAKRNKIGNGTASGRNILSGNGRAGLRIEWAGADSNMVQGNYIGVGKDGSTIIYNGEAGLVISRGASHNLIGGEQPGQANVISGNHSSGVQFRGSVTANTFKGNFVGTDATGNLPVPNQHNGIYLYGSSANGFPQYNVIGPNNVICSNGVDPSKIWWGGVSIDNEGTAFNKVFGNYIGQNPSGSLQEGQPFGVLIQRGAHDNEIGPDNVIVNSFKRSGFGGDGVHVMHENTIQNKITRNRIFNNWNKAIVNEDGGNENISPPSNLQMEANRITGTAIPNSTVEIFADENGQAKNFLGSTTADSQGKFAWNGSAPEMIITAVNIDVNGNTSELSEGVALPVELSSFKAIPINNSVLLKWTTLSETNNFGFALERRLKDSQFRQIAFLPGFGTSEKENHYEFKDEKLLPGIYFYRLKQIDTDARYSYSDVISVRVKMQTEDKVINAYPNPFNSSTNIMFKMNVTGKYELAVFDILGRRIRTLGLGNLESGWYEKTWDGRDDNALPMPSGAYWIIFKAEQQIYKRPILLIR